jgi:glycerate 2-kinase
MAHLVAAFDKFRGTATAESLDAAVAASALRFGWTVDQIPMSDGGEGLLWAAGGERRTTLVTGPLGASTLAEWRMVTNGRDTSQASTAVIEMAQASGRALVPHPSGRDPLNASTIGVGQLIIAAVDAGATRIVVGCGGSATTDGGLGAIEVLGTKDRLQGTELIVASDVSTTFVDAASVFAPQKGANPSQVAQLRQRLVDLSLRYRQEFGVDVASLPGAGAAGGLAGGLVALGATIHPGFGLVADLVGLEDRLKPADLVVTGEGYLDPPSFAGKVVGGLAAIVAGRCPILCVVGDFDADLGQPGRSGPVPAGLEVVSLVQRFGPDRARKETIDLVAQVVAERLSAH